MHIRRIVDLSRPIGPETHAFPGDPSPVLTPLKSTDTDLANATDVRMTSHSGTHADAPYHFLEDGTHLDDLPLELFTGSAVVVDVTGHADRAPITPDDLAPWRERLGPGTVVLLRTGWDVHYRTERYFHHPYLHGDTARLLVDAGVRTVGVDTLSPDETPYGDRDSGDWTAHHTILGAGGTIIENLCHLEEVDFPRPWFVAFPIRLASHDGAPVRAVALNTA